MTKKLNAEQLRELNINKALHEGAKKKLAMAKANKNDEFYTRMEDIADEVKHHKNHFKNKVVLMNCDDPKWSNFWKYFEKNQQPFGIKKLISTHYEPDGSPSYALIREKVIRDKREGYSTKKVQLKGDGDFRSEECMDFLKEADIVVTNPPFSLFREYVELLIEKKKKFLIIGNINAITYKETFKLIKSGKLHTGSGQRVNHFHNDINGETTSGASGCWFTNLGTPADRLRIQLSELYEGYEDKYPKYDNYDAINVNKAKDIPADYYGIMGVPITFLHKLNTDQFEIIGIVNGSRELNPYDVTHPFVEGKRLYARLLIKRKD